jgi:hypothetical protein
VADEKAGPVGRIDRYPRLDRGVRVQDAAEGRFLRVHAIGGAVAERIGSGNLDQRTQGLGTCVRGETHHGSESEEAANSKAAGES